MVSRECEKGQRLRGEGARVEESADHRRPRRRRLRGRDHRWERFEYPCIEAAERGGEREDGLEGRTELSGVAGWVVVVVVVVVK